MTLVDTLTLAAQAVGVSPALLLSVCFQESSLVNLPPRMDGGSASIGVCQVKYGTAQMIEPGIHQSRLSNPYVNGRIAAKYLKQLIEHYDGRVWCGVNAFNTGPGKTKCNSKTHKTRYVRKVKAHLREKPWTM